MTLPIPPISNAAQWSVGQIGGAGAPGEAAKAAKAQESDPTGGFGSMLTNAIGDLEKTQNVAAEQSQALATGQTQDISSVITAVQEAQLSMQLASQVRNKAVEAYTEIFHTQI
jgi:flagellar hook-basal body complex protein FliE